RDEPHNEYRLEGRFRRRYNGRWTLGSRRAGVNASASVTPLVEQTPILLPSGEGPRIVGAGRVIKSITFRSDGRFDTSALTHYLAVKPCEPLSIRAIQSAIKSIFATGDFRDVRVESVDESDGVAVTFALFLNYRVGGIDFDGIHGSDRARAERELTIRTGDVVSLSAIDHSAVAVQQYLNRIGYLDATIEPETTFHRDRNRADIAFHVVTGPRARITAIVFEGDITPFTPQALIS